MFVKQDEKETNAVPGRECGALKLSEAIRMGAKLRPACTGVWFQNGRSCALGAAFESYYGRVADMPKGFPSDQDNALLGKAFPVLRVQRRDTLYGSIFKKNDGGESREAIADWLESKGL